VRTRKSCAREHHAGRDSAAIGEGNSILAAISNGKIDELIAQTLQGRHEKMKQAVNNIAIVSRACRRNWPATDRLHAGSCPSVGKQDQFRGAYAEIVRGVNSVLDAIIAPLKFSAGYIDRISKGDLPPQITDTYHGDFNVIKDNLNALIGRHGRNNQCRR